MGIMVIKVKNLTKLNKNVIMYLKEKRNDRKRSYRYFMC